MSPSSEVSTDFTIAPYSDLVTQAGTIGTMDYSVGGTGERQVQNTYTNGQISSTRAFLYDREDVIAEFSNDTFATVFRRYIHGPGIDEPLAILGDDVGEYTYYLHDGLGSVTGVVDENGKLGAIDYSAFGETRSNTVKIENRYRYTSREFVETNLYYYRARHMRPDLGRFISMDPLKTVDGTNLYGYVGNNPVDFFDPDGLWIRCVSASDTHWIGLGSLLHRLPGGHTKWLFNLIWFDAECPQCESPTSPSVRLIDIKGYPALPIHKYIQANPQIEFVEQISKNHLRYGVSVQTRIAGWMPSSMISIFLQLCYDCAISN